MVADAGPGQGWQVANGNRVQREIAIGLLWHRSRERPRCWRGAYCRDGLRCPFGHTESERKLFWTQEQMWWAWRFDDASDGGADCGQCALEEDATEYDDDSEYFSASEEEAEAGVCGGSQIAGVVGDRIQAGADREADDRLSGGAGDRADRAGDEAEAGERNGRVAQEDAGQGGSGTGSSADSRAGAGWVQVGRKGARLLPQPKPKAVALLTNRYSVLGCDGDCGDGNAGTQQRRQEVFEFTAAAVNRKAQKTRANKKAAKAAAQEREQAGAAAAVAARQQAEARAKADKARAGWGRFWAGLGESAIHPRYAMWGRQAVCRELVEVWLDQQEQELQFDGMEDIGSEPE